MSKTTEPMTRLALHASLALAEQQRDELLAALKRAQLDLQDLVNDDDIEIDPQFALDRVNAAIAQAERRPIEGIDYVSGGGRVRYEGEGRQP